METLKRTNKKVLSSLKGGFGKELMHVMAVHAGEQREDLKHFLVLSMEKLPYQHAKLSGTMVTGDKLFCFLVRNLYFIFIRTD